ncbi:hypothetical protein FGIG_01498 [Fasciola gigantica]|uniref:Aprataxin and PNK-like factor PBZ domain-containing protein n=1 Tax=Fasciola gigantica TaxID=46835 RepID=A0A504Y7B3_FASGI|nr:hypothetical protein FGIG_01498 [Fasciola gigantica]
MCYCRAVQSVVMFQATMCPATAQPYVRRTIFARAVHALCRVLFGISPQSIWCNAKFVVDLFVHCSTPADALVVPELVYYFFLDYLAEEGVPVSDFIQSCLNNIDPNLFGASGPTEQSPVCRDCSLQLLSKLAYQQREAIPQHELPVSVTARPDCYYGRNCRTQRTKMSRAHRYNHICEQRRS